MKYCSVLVALLLGCAPVVAYAQRTPPSVRWLKDSVELGRPVPLAITVINPVGTTLALPDSAAGWQPWEYVQTVHSSRQPVGSAQVADSVVVLVRSFSIAPRQALRSYVVRKEGLRVDTLWFTTDSLPFIRHVAEPIKGQAFRPDVVLIPLADAPTYWGWAVLGAVVIVACVLGVIFLRRPLALWLARRRLLREYRLLRAGLTQARQHSQTAPLRALNQAMALARGYLAPVWQVPLHALTHHELMQIAAPVSSDVWQQWAELAQKEEQVNYARLPLGPDQADTWLSRLEDHLAAELTRRLNQLNRA